MKITILHDRSGNWGYGPSLLEEVFSYEVPEELSDASDGLLLEHAFEIFNVGDPELALVQAYRALELRSLSVGDAVRIGDDTYLCKPLGWKKMRS